ncbi:hypothetical protein [Frankia sp. CiP3]|uniref:hypothetical protein n=1 Tax=Frankia sp. CiP3 TaxID=2880971 RepID=UPI001EF41DC2|nr:hypothetical protein [Frankia sp. CiP3]
MTESPAPAPSFAPFFTDIVAAGMRWPRHTGDGFAPEFSATLAAGMRWPRHTGDGFALDAVSARR